MNKAVFLDIDGVLVELVDHFGEYGVSPRIPDEIKVVEGLEKLFDDLAGCGWLFIGITNQPDVARKKIKPEFLDEKHKRVVSRYPQIKKILVCPHTETDLCRCRKPKPGLLRQAAKELEIDFSLSWMIGDSRSDVEAGKLVHCKTIFLQTPYNCADPAIDKCTAVAKSVKGALSLILALAKGASNRHDA